MGGPPHPPQSAAGSHSHFDARGGQPEMAVKMIGYALIGGSLLGSVGACLVEPAVGATMGALIGVALGYEYGNLLDDQRTVCPYGRNDGGRDGERHWR
jgi:hypothetical protein